MRLVFGLISIHALLAESDSIFKLGDQSITVISIHALLAESDGCLVYQLFAIGISIHALLAESDQIPHRGQNS